MRVFAQEHFDIRVDVVLRDERRRDREERRIAVFVLDRMAVEDVQKERRRDVAREGGAAAARDDPAFLYVLGAARVDGGQIALRTRDAERVSVPST